jgi:BMFP domain-containing protein YqiC
MDRAVGIAVVLADTENVGTLIGIIAGALGAACGALGTFLARRYQIKSATALTEQQRLFDQYRLLVEDLQGQIAQLRGEVKDIQRQYLEARVENAALKARIGDLETKTQEPRGKPADGTGEDPRPANRERPD